MIVIMLTRTSQNPILKPSHMPTRRRKARPTRPRRSNPHLIRPQHHRPTRAPPLPQPSPNLRRPPSPPTLPHQPSNNLPNLHPHNDNNQHPHKTPTSTTNPHPNHHNDNFCHLFFLIRLPLPPRHRPPIKLHNPLHPLLRRLRPDPLLLQPSQH